VKGKKVNNELWTEITLAALEKKQWDLKNIPQKLLRRVVN
jgi:hypothetical protein